MKKSRIIVISAILLATMFFIGNQNSTTINTRNPKIAQAPQIKVVATTTLLRDFAQQIVGDSGTVDIIIESGTCPGHYDYKPSDIVKVTDADVVFYHGFEGSLFLNELLTEAGNLDAAYSMSGNGSLGWTQWGAPANAVLFLDVICTHLNNTYPLLNTTFNQNCATYSAEVLAKKSEIETQNAAYYNFTDVKSYTMKHQKSFMMWLGFNITGEWDMDDNSMNPSEFAAIIDGAYSTGSQIIVMNYQSGTVKGKEAADYLGIPSAALLNFPGVYEALSYLEQLDFNVALLNWAINNGPDPRGSLTMEIGIDVVVPLMAFGILGMYIITSKTAKRMRIK